ASLAKPLLRRFTPWSAADTRESTSSVGLRLGGSVGLGTRGRGSECKSVGCRVGSAVRDRDQNITYSASQCCFLGSAADENTRLAIKRVSYLDVGPGDSAAPPSSKGLQNRLLGGPAACEVLNRMLA